MSRVEPAVFRLALGQQDVREGAAASARRGHRANPGIRGRRVRSKAPAVQRQLLAGFPKLRDSVEPVIEVRYKPVVSELNSHRVDQARRRLYR